MLNRIILQNSCNLWVCGRSDVLLLTVDPQRHLDFFLGLLLAEASGSPFDNIIISHFLELRLGGIHSESERPCKAWALMHFLALLHLC